MRHSAPARPGGFRAALLVSASALALTAAPAAAEGPSGGVVARGKAAISAGAGRTTVRQTSRRAIVDWKRFDVSHDHVVDFVQPGKGAATLNRVDSARRSVIEGAVRAPGTVVIQNRAGVVFTRDARVDVGGLVAASQDIDAGRFQRNGRLSIGGGEAAGARVVNEGRITVGEKGLAALVGGSVENSGVIVARRGAAVLASGARTTLDLAGDGVFRIAVEGDATGAAPGVSNTGVIDAAEGRVLLSAGAAARALDAAINTTGVIRAGSASGDGGAVVLAGRGKGVVRVGGEVDVSGRRGGKVTATGERIELAPAARIDARGVTDGGRVRLGGDRAGHGPLTRAASLGMAEGASIDASGATGRGGDVVLWSDGGTAVDGTIRAAGGAAGGFIETSGAGALAIGAGALVDPGAGGAWLLDPRDVVIGVSSAGVTGGVNAPPATGAGPWVINAGAIVTALNGGADVTITTVQPAYADAGDITVSTAVGWSGSGDLRLQADGSIIVNANLQAAGAGDLTLSAGAGDIVVGGGGVRTVSTRTGALRMDAPRGQITLQRTNAQSSSVQIHSESGDIDLTAGERILLQGGAVGGRWVRVGRTTDSADVTLRAPEIVIQGGEAGNNFAEVVAGPGGSIEMRADLISVLNGRGDQGRIQATDGATLKLLGERQVWDGPVRSGAGGNNGGSVTIAGSIRAGFQPQFSLRRDANFTYLPAAPGGTASTYYSTEPFAVDIIPTVSAPGATGRIDIDAPVKAAQVTLETEAGVRLGPRGMLRGTEAGDAVVVAAGAEFRNDSALGADAFVVNAAERRWLLYIDAFGGLVGPAPAPRDFDLYGRTYASHPPLAIDFEGNRIVYGERPTLTLTGDRLGKTYGETIAFGPGRPGYVASGLRPGDSLATALDGAPVASSAGAAAGAPVAGSPYAIDIAAAASAQGYIVETVAGSIALRRAPLTVTAADSRRTYGAANPAFTAGFSGFVNGEGQGALGGALRFDTPGGQGSDVGRYAVTPGGLTSGNYAITFVPGAMTIDPAALFVTPNAQRRRYGSSEFDGRAFSASGFVLGQDAGVISGSLSTDATAASNVGAYGIGQGTLSAGNYVITAAPGTLTIDPAVLRLSIDPQSRSYGSADFDSRAFSASGFVLGQDASVITGELVTHATQTSNVGTYAIKRGTLAAANYVIEGPKGVMTVNPAVLNVSIDDQRRSYGSGAFDAQAFAASGFVLGQDASVLTGALATNAAASSDVGAYGIGKGTLAAANYVIAAAPGTLTIDPAVLTVAIDDQRRTYGSGAFDRDAYTASGFVLGQDASVLTGGLGTSATAASNVGAYGIGKGTLAAANYVIAAAPGTLTIDPAVLTVSIDDQRRSYGSGAFDGRAFSASGFVLGEDAGVIAGAVATTATSASNVGTYGIGKGTLAAANYVITADPGALTIDPAVLKVSIDDQRRTYGSGAFNGRGFTATGFVLGQDQRVVTGALATGATAASDVGAYGVGSGTLAAANYVIDADPGTLSITPARMRVRVNDAQRGYGQADPALSVRYLDPFVLGQSAGGLGWRPSVSSGAAQDSNVGVYAMTARGIESGNYAVEYLPGRLTVNPADLRVTIHDKTRDYGAANPRFTWDAEGFVLGQGEDLVTGAPWTAAGPASDAGSYDIEGGTLAAANYRLWVSTGVLTVEPVTLDLRIHDQRKTYGAVNPRLGWEATGFVLGQDESVVLGDLATTAGTRSGAGDYAITTGTLLSRNYVIPEVTGTLSIDPAALTVTAEDAVRPQGAPNPAFSARYDGFVLGEDAGVLGGRLVFATDATPASPSGRYAVTPGGLVSGNYAITYRPGTLSVQPRPAPAPAPAPDIASIDDSLDLPERGLPPYTPGDSAFRTTKYEAPIARDSTFQLTYSLGEVVQSAPAGAAQGGFVPASGVSGDDGGGGAPATCGGPIGLGAAPTGCVRSATAESFWTTAFPGAAQ